MSEEGIAITSSCGIDPARQRSVEESGHCAGSGLESAPFSKLKLSLFDARGRV